MNEKLKSLAILFIILVSLVPAFLLYKYLERSMRPRDSVKRFIAWLFSVFILVFAYTFLVVFVIRLFFPGA
jgi:hypothetical protein